MKNTIYVVIDNQQAGPYSPEQIREMLKKNEISAQSLVWFESMKDWQPLHEVLPEFLVTKKPARWLKPVIWSCVAVIAIITVIGVSAVWLKKTANNQPPPPKTVPAEKQDSFSMAEPLGWDEEYQEALELSKTADLSKPTLEIVQAAALTANAEILEKLHQNGFRDWHNPDIILAAARYGSVGLIEKLISYGADINAKSRHGETMIHAAAEGGNINMVKYLVAKGLNINAKTNGGVTALRCAAYSGNVDLAEYLVEKGLDVNAKAHSGATALHNAALFNNVDMVKYLVEKGADVNAKNEFSVTPLDYASNEEIKSYLISKGAVSGKK